MIFKYQKILIFLIFTILLCSVISFFNKNLGIGLGFVIFLAVITNFVFFKIVTKDKILFLLFLIVLFTHTLIVLFIYYKNFQPFSGGGGDYLIYHQQAQEIAQRLRQGDFSLKGIGLGHYYPVIVGYIYAFTLPTMLMGQLFNAWIAAISILLVYLIVQEIGGSKKWAFLIGLIVCFYPSYLFYGSLLLKDGLVVLFALAGLLFLLKLIKEFLWRNFIIFFVFLTVLIHFRFYIGYALLFTFIFCWPLLNKLKLKQRLSYGIIMIFLLGFSPQICGYGYYGIYAFKQFLNPQQISFYREIAYNPSNLSDTGKSSSIVIKLEFNKPFSFPLNYSKSFIYVLLGPLPWQMKYPRHFLALIETIPWYILLFFIIKGAINSFKNKRVALPLIVFSFGLLVVLALFLSNFGIVTRIRIPAFISLLCLIPLGFKVKNQGLERVFNKIKVCQVATVDSSIKFLLLNQMKFLQKQGYIVSAVCSFGKWVESIERENIKVKTIRIKRKIFSPISDLLALIKLFFYFKKEKFDIVHTHTPKAAFLGQLAAKMAGIPVIINTIHGFYFTENSSFFKRKFFILIEKIAAQCSDLIFSVNKEDIKTAIKEKICSYEKVRYLGGWVDLKRFNPLRFSSDFIKEKKRKLKLPFNFKIVGIVARLVKEKGYLDLFEAFKTVLNKFPNTILLIVGAEEPEKKDGINPQIVQKYGIEKNTIFLGERTDIEEIYPLIDIFVLPSYREGLGLSAIEASAMERPVINTNIRGFREILENNKTGILVPVKNIQKLAEAIIYLLENPEKAKEMGKNGRKNVIQEFDERFVFDRIKKEYENLIREKVGHKRREFMKRGLFLKRCFDIFVALIGLVFLFPLFLIVAILIKLDSKGPVFFKYERIGKNGKPFYPFKFRTMIDGAINKGLGYNVIQKDERITRIGRFLRKWGIDELPQLINVLKGEMSLIGPRPTFRYQVEKYNDFQKKRLLMKPGLTSLALTYGRNLLSWEERIKYDVWYVENWSLWLDFKIVLKTFYVIFIKQEGIYGKDGINDDPFFKK